MAPPRPPLRQRKPLRPWLYWGRDRGTSWEGEPDGRPRVLLECPEHATPVAVAHALSDAGYDVATCAGPDHLDACPLATHDGHCDLVGEADVVVNLMGIGDTERRAVVSAQRTRYPDIPLVIEATQPQVDEADVPLDGAEVVLAPVTRDALLGAVAAALDRPPLATT